MNKNITYFLFRRHTNVVRSQIDEAIRTIRMLCDNFVLKNWKSEKNENLQLSINESDVLIEGLRQIFSNSSEDEQIRLLTVAPIDWGRNKIAKFFNCSVHQARTALELRQTLGVLAYPISTRGNEPIDPEIVDKVLDFYRQDGISRPSPNRKDVILINGKNVAKRFMEMTISQAFESFCIENPSMRLSRSKFFELRPKDVKPESPHDVCVCIYHENLTLLLKVSKNHKISKFIDAYL